MIKYTTLVDNSRMRFALFRPVTPTGFDELSQY